MRNTTANIADLQRENEILRRELSRSQELLYIRATRQELTTLILGDAMFPIVIVALDSAEILYINQYAAKFFDVDEGEAKRRLATDFWATDESRLDYIKQLQKNGQVYDLEVEFLNNKKQKKQAVLSSRRVNFNNQEAIYTVFSDITARRAAQRALRDSESRYQKLYNLVRLMADNQPDLIWAKDLNDNFLFTNVAIRNKLLMCGDEDPIGKSDLYFAKRERAAGHKHTFGEICINSDEVIKRTKIQDRFLEDGLVRGKYLALDVYKAPMFDNNGMLIGTVGAGRNVTRDIAVKKALEESEKRFRLLANNLRDVLWISDLEFNPTYVTPAIEELSGYTPEQFLDVPVEIHMAARYQRKYKGLVRLLDYAIKQGKKLSPRFLEFECIRKDGASVWVEINVSVLRNRQGVPTGFTGMIRDCTKRINQQNELEVTRKRALAASKAKSEFLANMSHELRTPLNGVLGILQLLMDTTLSTIQKGYVETALSAGGSLLQIISDILDFSKIEAGFVELDNRRFNLEEMVVSVLSSFQTLVEPSEVKIDYAVSEDVPPWIVGDEQRIRQILFNLVGNAVKFTRKGSVKVKVSCQKVDHREGLMLSVGVYDSGVGISQEIIGRLFEPFVQEDGSFRRKYGGTGLGLSIVKNLVDLMEGDIQLTSIVGVGTKVDFQILVQDAPSPKNNEFKQIRRNRSPEKVIKILVVEDEKINAMVISAMLTQLGYFVTIATSGIEALSLLEEHEFDCIFMDIQMPDMDGVETTKLIRSKFKKNIPIVALTAHAIKGDKERFIAAGMDDYLSKPVSAEKLTSLLTEIEG